MENATKTENEVTEDIEEEKQKQIEELMEKIKENE